MRLEKEDVAALIVKHLQQDLSIEEASMLEIWVSQRNQNKVFFDYISDQQLLIQKLSSFNKDQTVSEWPKLLNMISNGDETHLEEKTRHQNQPNRNIYFLKRWLAVASLVFAVATGAYFWIKNSMEQELLGKNKSLQAIGEPGKDGAILTLSDGREVILNSFGNGVVASQNGAKVMVKDGQLSYHPTANSEGNMEFNTLRTPKGKQFNLWLPDGTKVWLNAASSLRYPTQFEEKDRIVSVTGEVYFEVEHDNKKPFTVKTSKGNIEVLGTSFNVNCFEDELFMKTTLVDGSVQFISVENKKVQLKPGQSITIIDSISQISEESIEKILSWKNGYFSFHDVDIKDLMKQISRWYDVEIVYQKSISNKKFRGEISRELNLNEIIAVLHSSKIECVLDGRKLIVQ